MEALEPFVRDRSMDICGSAAVLCGRVPSDPHHLTHNRVYRDRVRQAAKLVDMSAQDRATTSRDPCADSESAV